MSRLTYDKTILNKFSGIIIVALLYDVWGCNTVAYKSKLFLFLGLALSVFALVIYCWAHSYTVHRFKEYRKELLSLDVFLALVGAVLSYGTFNTAINPTIHDKLCAGYIHCLGITIDLAAIDLGIELMIWSVCTAVLWYRGMIAQEKLFVRGSIRCVGNRIKRIVDDNRIFIVLLISVLVLCYDPIWRQFKWDGYLYYLWSNSLSIYSLSNMAMYSHISQFHSLIIVFFKYILGDLSLSMYITNVVLFLSSVIFFYKTMQLLEPNRRKIIYVLGTSVYAFSPFYLGMVTYYSLDYTMMCLFPAVIYYLLRKRWVSFTVASLFFCFTKEPAIIIYGLLCMGMIIVDVIIHKRKMGTMLKTVHYYYMMLPGILWVVTLIYLGFWSGESSVGYKSDYAIDKLKVLFVLNYNWIFVIIIGLGIVLGVYHYKENKSELEIFLLIILVMIGFTFFSIILMTANHPRYSDIIPYSLYLLAVLAIIRLSNKDRIVGSILTILSIFMLLSCFFTIDPISLAVFDSVDVGTTKMIKTSGIFGDGSIYNRQALWMEKPYLDAIKDSLYEDMNIIVLTYKDSIYDVDGMSEQLVTKDGYYVKEYSFDERREIRQPLEDERTKCFDIVFLGSQGNLSSIVDYEGMVSIIYPEYVNLSDYRELEDVSKNSSIQTYHYRGYTFYRMLADISK